MANYIYNRLVFLLSLGGIFVAGMLVLFDWKIILLPCSTGGCATVANWGPSKFISATGLLFYLAIAGLSWRRAMLPEEKWRPLNLAVFGLSILGGLISWFLIYYADAYLAARCDWCLASAFLVTGILAIAAFQVTPKSVPPKVLNVPGGDKRLFAALVVVLILGGGGFGATAYMEQSRVVERDRQTVGLLLPKDLNLRAKGPDNAPVTIVEFSDFNCPACIRSHSRLKAITTLNDTSIRYIHRHFPIVHLPGHASSFAAAAAVEIAHKQDPKKGWALYEEIFHFGIDNVDKSPRATLSDNELMRMAQKVGLDMAAFRAQYEKAAYGDDLTAEAFVRVNRDIQDAHKLGVLQTPTFFIITRDNRVRQVSEAGLSKALNEEGVKEHLQRAPTADALPAGHSEHDGHNH